MEILELSCERLLVDLKPFRVHLKSCHFLHDTREKDRLLVSVTRYRHLGGGGGGRRRNGEEEGKEKKKKASEKGASFLKVFPSGRQLTTRP